MQFTLKPFLTRLAGMTAGGLLLLAPGAATAFGGDPTLKDPYPAVSEAPVQERQAEEELPAVSSAPPEKAQPASCQGDSSDVVGRVVATSGSVHAQSPGSDPRSLSCNDVIHACETVITSPGARVGLMSGDVYAHLDSDSQLQIGRDGDLPKLLLRSGNMRLIDARESGAPAIAVSTPHLSTRAQETDTEMFINADANTRVCNHLGSVDVAATAGGAPLSLGASCAVSNGIDVSAGAASAPSLDVQDAPQCEFQIANLFTPTDVASPDFGLAAFPGSDPAGNFLRDPCEASGCGVRVAPPPPTGNPPPPGRSPKIIIDPDPVSPCGGGGFGCGGSTD